MIQKNTRVMHALGGCWAALSNAWGWVLASVLLASSAQATVIVYQSDAELFEQSDVVAVAKVWRKHTELHEGSVTSVYELELTESLKGPLPKGSFTLMRSFGGELEVDDEAQTGSGSRAGVDLGGIGTYLAGAPHPQPGSTIIVFLAKPDTGGEFFVTGFTLGQYELRYDARLKRQMAHRDVDAVDIVLRTPTRDGEVQRALVPSERLASPLLDELRQLAKDKARGHQ